MVYITNAFSITMLEGDTNVSFTQVSIEEAKVVATNAESAVGHADTAELFSNILGISVRMNRISVKMQDTILVGQYSGPRLPEGTSVLPEGAKVQWWVVKKVVD